MKQYFIQPYYLPDMPLINVSTKLTIFLRILSPIVFRCNNVGLSPMSSSSISSLIGSCSEYR